MRFSFLCSFFLILSVVYADSVIQNDWSDGDGFPGPTNSWGNTFDSSRSITWSIPDELRLGVELDLNVEVLPISFGNPLSIHPIWADVNRDGYTDVLYVPSTNNTVYWIENPGQIQDDWALHYINEFNEIQSISEFLYQGAFYGFAVAYQEQYGDENVVDFCRNFSSPDNWYTYRVGYLGEKEYSCGVTVGDLDGDDYPDIIGWKWAYDEVLVWRDCIPGNGELLIYPHCPTRVDLHDLDEDGDSELIVCIGWVPSTRVYWNNGGSFSNTLIPDVWYINTTSAADVDGDGFSELTFSMYNNLHLSHWNGSNWEDNLLASSTGRPKFSDLNGDGFQDIICATGNKLTLLYNENQGDAWFSVELVSGITQMCTLECTDINGDSITDFALWSNQGPWAWFELPEFRYSTFGYLVSSWLDPDMKCEWNTIFFDTVQPAGTDVSIQVRSSDLDSLPLPQWSPELESGADISPYCSYEDQFFQYRLNLYSSQSDITPTISSVTLDYTTNIDPNYSHVSSETIFRSLRNPTKSISVLICLPVSTECVMKIFDLAGRKVFFTNFTVISDAVTLLNLPELPSGIYHARLHSSSGISLTTRFTVLQ